jgi:hypothetical protein
MPLLLPKKHLFAPERHPLMPKSPPSGNKKAIKPDFQPDPKDFQDLLYDPMQPFLSLLCK